jgi:hypothetical protein
LPISRRSIAARRIGGKSYEELAEVPTLQQADEGGWRIVESLHDVLAVFEPAGAYHRRRDGPVFGKPLPLITNDETLDPKTFSDRRHQVGAGLRLNIVVFGDHAAEDHAGEVVETWKYHLLHCTSDVFPININAVRTSRVERDATICRSMVETGVEAKLVLDIPALGGTAGVPTTRAPAARASWPTTAPTAPDAAETVSPAFGWPMSDNPT